jgi:hypothetical protein
MALLRSVVHKSATAHDDIYYHMPTLACYLEAFTYAVYD